MLGTVRVNSNRHFDATMPVLEDRWSPATTLGYAYSIINSISYYGLTGYEMALCRKDCSTLQKSGVRAAAAAAAIPSGSLRGLAPGGLRSRALRPVSAAYT